MFIEPSDNFLKINLHLSWYNFYYVHNLSNLLRHFIQLFQEKKQNTRIQKSQKPMYQIGIIGLIWSPQEQPNCCSNHLFGKDSQSE